MMKQLKTLAILSLALTLGACGSSEPANTEAPAEEQQTQEAAEPVKEEKPAEQPIAFEPYTVIDNDECTVTVKEVKIDDRMEVKFEVENKSDSAEYKFSIRELAVNGISMDETSYAMSFGALPAGKKENKALTIDKDVLKDYGVDQDLTDIEVRMVVGDYNDYEAEPAADETFHIYPYGEDKAVIYVYEPAENHHVLLDTDEVKIVQVGFDDENIKIGGAAYAFRLYIENKTDSKMQAHSTEGYVNGYQIHPLFTNIIRPGKACFATWYIAEQSMEENNIETLEEAELKLSLSDYESHDTFFYDTITLVP